MQFWPRKKAKRIYPKVRSWAKIQEAKLLGFAGYKVGMAHVIAADNSPNSITKGQDISLPVTIIECPPIKIASVRLYKKDVNGLNTANEIMGKVDKEFGRKQVVPKKIDEKKIEGIKAEDYDEIRLLAYTQPKLTAIGKKKPEIFEIALGGSVEDKLKIAKEFLGKEVKVNDVFAENQLIDVHAITKGKGFQGPVKRFGISLKSHKSEKSRRVPGSLGGWKSQGHVMYRVAHAGQTGYQARTEYNKKILKICEIKDINTKSGFIRYGMVKNPCLLIKGSVQGAKKRVLRITAPLRANKKLETENLTIQNIIK